MASKNKAGPATPPTPAATNDGFVDETRPDIAGWIRPEAGLQIHGRIAGAFAFMAPQRGGGFKKRDVLCVKLLKECPIVQRDKEVVMAAPGSVAGLSINPCISNLRHYVNGKGEFKVEYLRKEQMSGGGETWKARLQVKGKRSPQAWYGSVQPRDEPIDADGLPRNEGVDSDDIPF